ncbi:polysaccharide deacetylase family protein [Vibrio mangrovi]|uniref:Polysaccharide deacetylase n=1 Tax=Vibrio mangrovi TaxID=474394 RepID=A0A1Y6IWD8_9VIBR|nr:polysaccharide deacetylase family protein [Vibrio mangrovi]MDW6003099.1 polysaccharide deacetylase family protein [Vibrio mangrovi]SMS01341.1 Polysaccharide deacetylase [Vibrio mangrovi]
MTGIRNIFAINLRLLWFCFGVLIFLSSYRVSAGEITFPNGAHIAVNLSYDDALPSQLENALPVLDKYGIKGSFYLLPTSLTLQDERVELWKKAARNGHELGNHTLYHSCSVKKGRTWMKPYADLDRRTPESMLAEVKLANTFLFLLDGQQRRTFTIPCGDTVTGGGDYLPEIRSVVTGIYGRTLSKQEEFYWSPHGVSAQQLIDFIRKAAGNRQTKIICIKFHGVGGDYLSVTKEDHQKLVQYLADNQEKYWVSTYKNIVDYVHQHSSE